MKLLIKQRVLALTDSYDVYDEYGNTAYTVQNRLFSPLHHLTVTDLFGHEVGSVDQKLTMFFPAFNITVNGRYAGRITQEPALFRRKYTVDYGNWYCKGDLFGWDYSVYDPEGQVLYIEKKLFRWGDTYVVDIFNDQDTLMGLMLVLAIDAANCSQNN